MKKRKIYTHISSLYINKFYRDVSFTSLVNNSIKYFKKAYLIQNLSKAENYFNLVFTLLKNGAKKIPQEDPRFSEESLMDAIKIIICFENYMKAVLIRKGYLVHVINSKDFEKKFKPLGNINNKPIKFTDYKKIENFYYDINASHYILRGLKNNTVLFNTLLNNSDYKDIIKLPAQIIRLLNSFNLYRNSLHLKSRDFNLHSNKYFAEIKYLIKFVNKKMIVPYNKIIIKHDPKYGNRSIHDEIKIR
jgi:hypothetical protein